MGRVEGEPFGPGCPGFADEPRRRETAQALQAPTEVVGIGEVVEVTPEPVVAVVVVAPYRGVFDDPVHPLDLAVIRHDGLGALTSR